MKKLFSIFFFFICSFCFAQNLVPNPSFEVYSACPNDPCQIYKATGWSSYSGTWSSYGGTADYFHSCGASGWYSVPNSIFGYQYASTGNAYAGIICAALNTYCSSWLCKNNREHIGIKLLDSLIIGKTYYASVKVVLPESTPNTCANCGIDKLGILFSTRAFSLDSSCIHTLPPPPNLPNFAHIYANSIITDTANWVTISGFIVADSSYKYIIIGNFFDDANTNYQIINTDTFCCSYYFIDDVYVAEVPATVIEENNTQYGINILPNPATNMLNVVSAADFDYRIVDLLGNTVKTGYVATREEVIDITFIPAGFYILYVEINDFTITKKIIINP